MTEVIVSKLMQQPIIELDPDTDVEFAIEVAQLMKTHYFPIFRGGAMVGIVCTCDMDDAPRTQPICQLSHANVVTIPIHTTVSSAAELMHEKVVGSLVVLDGQVPCGILTREALVDADARWADYFADQHCEACRALKHLRTMSDGRLLCASCSGRAHDHGWLESGEGD